MSSQSNETAVDTVPVYTLSTELHQAARWLCDNKAPDTLGKVYSGASVAKLVETQRTTVSRIVSLYRHRVRQWNIPGCIYRVSESGDLLRINSYRDALPPRLMPVGTSISSTDAQLILSGLQTLTSGH